MHHVKKKKIIFLRFDCLQCIRKLVMSRPSPLIPPEFEEEPIANDG